MAQSFATVLVSMIVIFTLSVVFYAFARVVVDYYDRETSLLMIFVVVTIAYIGSFLVSWTVEYDEYQNDCKEAKMYQRQIQEYLVKNIPELEGIDPSKIVFANGEIKSDAVFVDDELKTIVKDDTALSLIRDYERLYDEFDYAVHLRERFWLFRELSTVLATMVITFVFLVIQNKIIEWRESVADRTRRKKITL
ncbi:hypothetical protein IKH83_02340 [Candidatus Saccharibacteria bacterium]|nr:hypothetical protein [Candidatus Saccharibacteria bacterium]